MDEMEARIEALYRDGSERLLGDSSLRDALDDDQAQQLLDWGLARLLAHAGALAALPPEQAQPAFDRAVQKVRHMMRQVNETVARRAQGSTDLYVAVLRFVEALQEIAPHRMQAAELVTLEKMAQNEGDLTPRQIFDELMKLINPEAA